MPKFWLAVLLSVLGIWGISLERCYAWIGLQSQQAQSWIARGLHPLSVDFRQAMEVGDFATADVLGQLIGRRAENANIEVRADGLRVTPAGPGMELRFNWTGAVLNPGDVSAVELNAHSLQASAKLPDFSLAVHGAANDPGWIADLPKSRDSPNSSERQILLASLRFYREPLRQQFISWNELPPLHYVRLYAGTPTKTEFVVSHVAFVLRAPIQTESLHQWRPERLLQQYQQLRSDERSAWPVVGYRGVWLTRFGLLSGCVICLGLFAALIGVEFASEKARGRAIARAMIVPTLCGPLMLLFWGYLQWPSSVSELFAPQWLSLALVIAATCGYVLLNSQSVSALRLDTRGFKHALLLTFPFAAILLIGFGLPNEEANLALAIKYLSFASLQQFLLQRFVFTNLRKAALSRSSAIGFSALIFALWHTPNFALMLLCFFAGLFWCWHYARYRRLLPLVLSHALLGWLCTGVLPHDLLRSANVGVSYFW